MICLKLDLAMYVYNPNTGETKRRRFWAQGQSQLHRKFEGSKGYMITYLKKIKQKVNLYNSSDKIQHL